MGIQHYKRIFFLLTMVTVTFFASTSDAGLSSSGSWSYGQSETTVGSSTFKSSFLNEIYTLSLSKRVTKLIGVSGNAVLIKRTVDDGTTETASEEVFPSVSISFRPPQIYTLNMGFTRSDSFPDNGIHSASTSMFATMNLKIKKLPGVNLQYRRSINETFDPKTLHTVSETFGAATSYSLVAGSWKGSVSLAYSLNSSEDKINDIRSTAATGNVSFNLGKSFFNKKLALAFSSTMGTRKTLYESLSGLKRFDYLVGNKEGYYLRPTDGNTCLIQPCSESTLRDGAVSVAAAAPAPYTLIGMDLDTDSWGVGLSLKNPVTLLYKVEVFVSTTHTTVTLTQGAVNSMGFKVLTSGATGGVDWQPVAGTIKQVTFEQSIEGPKFVIELASPITSFEQFIMVRNTNSLGGGTSIKVTEVRAYAYFTRRDVEEYEATSDNFSWNFSANFRPTGRFSTSYVFSYSTASNDRLTDKRENYGQGLNTVFMVIPKKTSISLNFNESWTVQEGSEVNSSTGLGMSLGHKFNPNLTTSYSKRQTKSHGFATSTSNKITLLNENNSDSFSLLTKIYSGIDFQSSFSFSETESITILSESESLSYRLNLRPWTKVNMSIAGSENDYKSTVLSTGIVTKGSASGLNSHISYVPNDRVSFGLALALEPTQSQSVSGSWRVSRFVGFAVTGAFSDNVTSYSSTLNWRLMSKLAINVRYLTKEIDSVGTQLGSTSSSLFVSANMNFF